MLTETQLDGVSVHAKSVNAVEHGASLELGSTADGYEWAIYRFNPGVDALDSVAVLLDIPAGGAVWIGLADYEKQHWVFDGPYARSKTLAVDDPRYLSAGGELFVTVAVCDGCSATVQSLSVRTLRPDNQAPWADLTADVLAGDAPLAVQFDAAASIDPDGELRYFMWDFDGDGGFDRTTFTATTAYTYTGAGMFSAAVAAVDDLGAWATDSVLIDVGAVGNTDPEAVLAVLPDSGDAPLAVTLNASASSDPDGSIVRFDYDFDNDSVWDAYDAPDSVVHTYTVAGLYTAKVRVTDNAGAQDEQTATVTVDVAGNASPTAGLTASRIPDYSSFTFDFDASDSTDSDGVIVKYEWDFDGDGSYEEYSTSSTATYTYSSFKQYSAAVRVTDDRGAQDTAEFGISLQGFGVWWMFGMEPAHNRRSPYIGAQTNNVKWSFNTGNMVYCSPTIGSDGTIYIGNHSNQLYALRPNGSLKWSYNTGNAVISSPAIGADGTIYFGSYDGLLYALNQNGSLKWAFNAGTAIYSSPVIGMDGTVYFGCLDNKLYACNLDGSFKWSYSTAIGIHSSPALGADGTVYIGSSDHKLHAINPDGSFKWSYTTGNEINSSPAIGVDGTVYIGSSDHKLYAINPDGSFKWSYTTGNEVNSSPAIGVDGTVYVGSHDDYLYAIDAEGNYKWSFLVGDVYLSSPAIGADGTIYVGGMSRWFDAIDPDGNLKWAYLTGNYVNSSPAIGADGTVYVGSCDGNLYAFGPTP